MQQRPLLLFLFLFITVALSGCSKKTSTPNVAIDPNRAPVLVSSISFVKAGADAVQIPAGGSANATVHITIKSGYHVNANPATESYLRATELIVQTTDGMSVGFITYPTATTKTFAFSKKALAVYEGETVITVMLKGAKSATKGQHSLAAKLNVQACDEQVCYAPGVIDLTIPVTVN